MSENLSNVKIDLLSYQPHQIITDLISKRIDMGLLIKGYYPIDTLPIDVYQKNGVSIVPEHLKNMSRKGITFIKINELDSYLGVCMVYNTENNNPIIVVFY